MENLTSEYEIDPQFPNDLFTRGQLQSGGILLHLIGIIYMSFGLVFIYKEFFIPCLFALIHRVSCTQDVAGGAVLAIGVLLPDLIVNIIFAFIESPGESSLGHHVGSVSFILLIYLGIAGCAGRSFRLSGLSIGREFIFQFLTILALVGFMVDNVLQVYELIILILVYGIYCLLLKFNGRIRKFIDKKCSKPAPKTGELQLDDHNQASSEPDNQVDLTNLQSLTESKLNENPLTLKFNDKNTTCDKIFFVILFPLIAISWLLMNWFDVRKPGKRMFFAINYVLSIVLMGVMSYLIVWWLTIFGNVVGLPAEVTGLTVAAFAFNAPIFYLIVLCAKNSCGDLILSMASGINIFNMTIGMSLPYFIYTVVFMDDIEVSSEGIICSALLIIIILVAVVSFLACFRRYLSKTLGIIYIIIYVLFVGVSISFVYGFVKCPV